MHNTQQRLKNKYLDNNFLVYAVSAVDSLDHVVRAAVLYNSISYSDFPFKHTDHKISIE